jgi:hypothetical protein
MNPCSGENALSHNLRGHLSFGRIRSNWATSLHGLVEPTFAESVDR